MCIKRHRLALHTPRGMPLLNAMNFMIIVLDYDG